MKWSARIGYFLAGVAMTNAAPHLNVALTGRRNLTPFGRDSSSSVNLLWSLINVVAGYLLMRFADKQAGDARSQAWLTPYETGRFFWSSFGLFYVLYILVFKKGDQDEKIN